MFGDPEVLPVKVIWDYTYYWGVLCQFFFQRRLTDLACCSRAEARVERQRRRSIFACRRCCVTGRPAASAANPPRMLDQAQLPWFAELNRSLARRARRRRLRGPHPRATTRAAHELAREIVANARADHADLDAGAELALLDGSPGAGSARMLFDPAA